MDKTILENQLIIMRCLLSTTTEKELVDDLMKQIRFTVARIRALV